MLTRMPVIRGVYPYEGASDPNNWIVYPDCHVDLEDEEVVFYSSMTAQAFALRDAINEIRRNFKRAYPNVYPIVIRYGIDGEGYFCINDDQDELEALLKFSK